MRRYTTKEVAKTIGVSYLTLLRWLYSKQLAEPERISYGGQSLRLWTKADIARARKYKKDGREEDVAGRAFVDALASPDHELEPFTSGNAIYRKLSRYSPPVYVNRYNHNVAIVR